MAIAAAPEPGKPAFEKWISKAGSDADVRWVLVENLKKNRLQRADPAWVTRCQAQLK